MNEVVYVRVEEGLHQHTITPEDVQEFWRVMQARYGTSLLDLGCIADIDTIYNALQKMGVGRSYPPSIETEPTLKHFALTVGTRIWTPFTIGIPIEEWTLWDQIKVCLHEHFHVARSRTFEGREYSFTYECNATARAYFEAEAYRNDMVLEWRYKNAVVDPSVYANKMYAYRCKDRDAAMVKKMLKLAQTAIKKGAIPGSVAQFACDWLDVRFTEEA